MPHHQHHSSKPNRKRTRLPSSSALHFVQSEQLDTVLSRLIPDAQDRAFIQRCLVSEGPLHHGGSNYLIVMLLGKILQQLPGADLPLQGVEVPMLLPPHLEPHIEDGVFPIRLPTNALNQLLGNDEPALEAAIDCLTDGPPQHSLANVVTVAMLDQILARLEDYGQRSP